MNVFIDTEFSGLGSNPRLISIGLVAELGEELYIEFTTGWNTEQCSRWVIENVLPKLGEGEQLPRRAAASRIDGWLEGLGANPILIVDSDWDAELIVNFFAECGIPDGKYPLQVLRFASKADANTFESARQRYFLEIGSQHHALSDAHALQFACEEVLFR